GPAYGKLTMLTGIVADPCAAAPVSLTTWSIVPTPPSETVRMSCSFTPGVTGTSNARVAWIVGSTLKKQYVPRPQPSRVLTESATLYAANPSTPSWVHAAWFGGSYGISFWNMIVLPFSPFQITS